MLVKADTNALLEQPRMHVLMCPEAQVPFQHVKLKLAAVTATATAENQL